MTIKIAGIGPRKITADGIDLVHYVAKQLAQMGFHLNSGHGDGADQAWASMFPDSQKTIYIPWWGFNGVIPEDNQSPFKLATQYVELYELAAQHHPGWLNLTHGQKMLMVRNASILLSDIDETPVEAVMYWQEPHIGLRAAGGTQHALRIAATLKIPCFNINTEEGQHGLDQWVSTR